MLISDEAKDIAQGEINDLGRTLAIITGAAGAIGLALTSMETVKEISPYYKAGLGVGATFLAVTSLTYHSAKMAFYKAVSKFAKKQEMGIRNGDIETQEKLPLIEDAEKEVKKTFKPYQYVTPKYLMRAFALTSAMSLASAAYYLSPNKEVVTIDRTREQQDNEQPSSVSPTVMIEPPRQPVAPALQ